MISFDVLKRVGGCNNIVVGRFNVGDVKFDTMRERSDVLLCKLPISREKKAGCTFYTSTSQPNRLTGVMHCLGRSSCNNHCSIILSST
jgi:hypothetical protein